MDFRDVRSDSDRTLVAGRTTLIANGEACDVHRFEIRESKNCQAAKIVIVPMSVGSPD